MAWAVHTEVVDMFVRTCTHNPAVNVYMYIYRYTYTAVYRNIWKRISLYLNDTEMLLYAPVDRIMVDIKSSLTLAASLGSSKTRLARKWSFFLNFELWLYNTGQSASGVIAAIFHQTYTNTTSAKKNNLVEIFSQTYYQTLLIVCKNEMTSCNGLYLHTSALHISKSTLPSHESGPPCETRRMPTWPANRSPRFVVMANSDVHDVYWLSWSSFSGVRRVPSLRVFKFKLCQSYEKTVTGIVSIQYYAGKIQYYGICTHVYVLHLAHA